MRRLNKEYKSKGGFSLLEMIIVVAIILIIASVVGFGVAGLLNTAHRSNDAVIGSSESLISQMDSGESKLANFSFQKT
jgi:prepilin-type N-terminal cleavage/methylation domain-containing protein